MQLFPRDGHGPARLEVFHSTRHFLVPGRLNGYISIFKAVEQSVGKCSALVNGEGERPS